jgi:uncharacterized protein
MERSRRNFGRPAPKGRAKARSTARRITSELEAMATATAPRDRVLSLDALRGFALFGILVMNVPSFWTYWPDKLSEQIWPSWYDGVELFVARWLFSGKFNSIFSFLFGLGFTMQLDRIEKTGGRPVRVYLRRIGALLLFGLIHAIFIWHGDILTLYALIGVVLLAMRRLPDRILLVIAFAAFFASPVAAYVKLARSTPASIQMEEAHDEQLVRARDAAYSRGSYLDATRVRWTILAEDFGDPWSLPGHAQILGTTLLGAFAARRKYLTHPEGRRPLFKRLFVASLLVGISALVAWSIGRAAWRPHQHTLLQVALSLAYTVQRPAIMITYVSGFILLASRPGRHPWLTPLATAGRMPLTNYLAHSTIASSIFYAYGLGFYNRCPPSLGFALAVLMYVLLVVGSTLWLRRHAFGPMESLWRVLTYGIARGTAAATPRLDPVPLYADGDHARQCQND